VLPEFFLAISAVTLYKFKALSFQKKWSMAGLRCLIFQVIFVSCLSAHLLVGCATIPVPSRSDRLGEAGLLGTCADFFASLDKRIKQAGVLDSGDFRVKKYPYLRANRFIASFREAVDNQAAFDAWTDRMQVLDQAARKFEIDNLPNTAIAALDTTNDRTSIYSKVKTCGNLLKIADFQSVSNQEWLKRNITGPDDYIGLRRFFGIYPFTSMFVYSGVRNWHAAAYKKFSHEPPVNWQSLRYYPARNIDELSDRQLLGPTGNDALGIPVFSREKLNAIFRRYAPVWEIQFQNDNDRIGTPTWTGKDVLDVDTDQPVTYTLLSFTRFGKDIFAQLNYIIWFPSRPKEGAFDIYGGFLDGLNYRVTLDRNNEPLLYETMHNCGCYYKAYPTNRLQIREQIVYAEPPLIFKAPEVNHLQNRMTVSMESRTHYVQHLYPSSRNPQSATTVYSLANYGRLRSLPESTRANKSMFGQNSITPGSERLERFILWPMGVLSPGAMRQWGRHAVAFVGRRHFDDPFFMDKMFYRNAE
jgi:hypothetical protein